jgi:CRISPR-associated protein Cmr4
MPIARLYFVHALSPLHPGTGQGTGVIDLPIAREKATGIPYLPGSSVKGTLRDSGPSEDVTTKRLFFGPDTISAAEHAGAAQFADTRLLLFPIRSLRGTFAWVTSPYLLRRLNRDAHDAGLPLDTICTIPPLSDVQHAAVSGKAIRYTPEQVVIEDLDLNVANDLTDLAQAWAAWIGRHALDADGAAMLQERLCIVHDDVLSFLLTTATEVIARVRLNPEEKTVAPGALWYEEALPAETLLVGIVFGQKIKDKNGQSFDAQQVMTELAKVHDVTYQFGGKATVGRGLCRVRIAGGGL